MEWKPSPQRGRDRGRGRWGWEPQWRGWVSEPSPQSGRDMGRGRWGWGRAMSSPTFTQESYFGLFSRSCCAKLPESPKDHPAAATSGCARGLRLPHEEQSLQALHSAGALHFASELRLPHEEQSLQALHCGGGAGGTSQATSLSATNTI